MSDDLKIILEPLTVIASRLTNIETEIVNLGTRFEAVETKVDHLQQEFITNREALREQLSEMHSDIRKLDRKFDLLNEV